MTSSMTGGSNSSGVDGGFIHNSHYHHHHHHHHQQQQQQQHYLYQQQQQHEELQQQQIQQQQYRHTAPILPSSPNSCLRRKSRRPGLEGLIPEEGRMQEDTLQPAAGPTVQFSSEPTSVVAIPTRLDQPRQDVWYSDEEYHRFKSDAKEAAQSARLQVERLKSALHLACSASQEEALWQPFIPRGVEHRLSGERSKRKYVALRAVLDSQKRIKVEMAKRRTQQLVAAGHVTPEAAAHADVDAMLHLVPPTAQEVADSQRRLAKVSTRFTLWAAQTAVEMAARDAQEVVVGGGPIMTNTGAAANRLAPTTTTMSTVTATATDTPTVPPPPMQTGFPTTAIGTPTDTYTHTHTQSHAMDNDVDMISVGGQPLPKSPSSFSSGSSSASPVSATGTDNAPVNHHNHHQHDDHNDDDDVAVMAAAAAAAAAPRSRRRRMAARRSNAFSQEYDEDNNDDDDDNDSIGPGGRNWKRRRLSATRRSSLISAARTVAEFEALHAKQQQSLAAGTKNRGH